MTAASGRDSLVLGNLRLVRAVIARRSWPVSQVLDADDLYQEGVIGLCRAADLYDPGRGVAFSTFAWSCIHNRILLAYAELKKPWRLAQEPYVASLEGIRDGRGEDAPLAAFVDGTRALWAQDGAETDPAAGAWVADALSPLRPRDRAMVLDRYVDGQTWTEIGRRHGLTRQGAQLAVRVALDRLRQEEAL
jgi:RNA polymerase sigma factor (sigma-70 family)